MLMRLARLMALLTMVCVVGGCSTALQTAPVQAGPNDSRQAQKSGTRESERAERGATKTEKSLEFPAHRERRSAREW